MQTPLRPLLVITNDSNLAKRRTGSQQAIIGEQPGIRQLITAVACQLGPRLNIHAIHLMLAIQGGFAPFGHQRQIILAANVAVIGEVETAIRQRGHLPQPIRLQTEG
ncbi:hypothetical protein D3C73_1378200 [compost metagenome]